MLAVRVWLIYLLAVFVGGPLLAPWMYWLVAALAGHLPVLEPLTQQPFSRYVSRCMQGIALASLWPMISALRLRSWQAVGWVRPRGNWRRLATGFLLGAGTLVAVALAALTFGGRGWKASPTVAELAAVLTRALATAAAVAVIEETIFRGAVMGTLRRELPWVGALVLSSLLYAWVHFLNRTNWAGPIQWHTGLTVLGRMAGGLFAWDALVPRGVSLALAGALLGYAFQRTDNLYFPIGLHAGWVAVLKVYGYATLEAADANLRFWGTGQLLDGWVAALALLLTVPLTRRLLASTAPKPEAA